MNKDFLTGHRLKKTTRAVNSALIWSMQSPFIIDL